MKVEKALGRICSITTGAPISRVRKIKEGDAPFEAKVLVPGAMRNGEIVESDLAVEQVASVKEEFFTREGDIIVKASTPYGCAYVESCHEGLLTTSYSLILRPLPHENIDMRYLYLFLNLSQSTQEMERMSSGMTIQLIKKKDLAAMSIPVLPLDEQKRLAMLYEQAQNVKMLCRRIEEKNNLLTEGELVRALFNN